MEHIVVPSRAFLLIILLPPPKGHVAFRQVPRFSGALSRDMFESLGWTSVLLCVLLLPRLWV